MNRSNRRQTLHRSSIQTSVHNSCRPSSSRGPNSSSPSHLFLPRSLPIETGHAHPHWRNYEDHRNRAPVAMTTRVCRRLSTDGSRGKYPITTMPTLDRLQVWRALMSHRWVHRMFQKEVRHTIILLLISVPSLSSAFSGVFACTICRVSMLKFSVLYVDGQLKNQCMHYPHHPVMHAIGDVSFWPKCITGRQDEGRDTRLLDRSLK